jgi:hypothetical protein
MQTISDPPSVNRGTLDRGTLPAQGDRALFADDVLTIATDRLRDG